MMRSIRVAVRRSLRALLILRAMPCAANTFTVINSGASDYIINGANDPTLTLYRGRAYTFNINAGGHPFWIKTIQSTGTGSAFNDGVTGNGTASGTLTFALPKNAPATLYYIGQFHAARLPIMGSLVFAEEFAVSYSLFCTGAESLVKSYDTPNSQSEAVC